ncbi:MAG TPA: ABC transporter permease [Candidatus Elarobacter sp.]
MVTQRWALVDDRLVDVVGVLFSQNIKIRYRGSVLGIVWSALNPLVMATVYSAVFGRTFAPYYGGSVVLYGCTVFIGLSLVGFFVASTSECSTILVQNGGLINKVRVPLEAFPLATIAAHAFQLIAGALPIVVVISLVVNHDPLRVLLLVIPLAALLMLTAGVGILVSAAGVFFRDVPHLYELATFLLWVTSPVFYPVAIVPHPLVHVLIFNPLFVILRSALDIVIAPVLPAPWLPMLGFAEGALALAVGIAAFAAMRPRFMDHL